MKRLIHILSLCVAVVLTASCISLDNVKITRATIDNIRPTGLRSVNISISLEVRNDGPAISVSEAKGTLFAADRAMGSFSIEPVAIAPRQTAWNRLDCSIRLDDNISLLEIIPLIRSGRISDFTVSYEASLGIWIFKKKVKQEKVPLSSFMTR